MNRTDGAACSDDSCARFGERAARLAAVNGAALLLDGWAPEARALVCRDERGRLELTAGQVRTASEELAAELAAVGVGRGDVVVTVLGSRAEWVLSMLAVLHLGAVALPCVEQLRPDDLAARLAATRPVAVVTGERHRELVDAAIARAAHQAPGMPSPAVLCPQREELLAARGTVVPEAAVLSPTDPALITFTSGTSGPAKAVVHGLRYIDGQRLQATEWLGARPGELSWCTAAPGWSKSARNVFMAPWLTGAAALLHDARFDPEERLQILREEQPQVLCMAPTEYRLVAKRTELEVPGSLRRLVAAGEALDPAVLAAWHEATGLWVRDGYGQTETGQLTAPPEGTDPVPGSMGRPLPGMALAVDGDELVIADPSTVPTFFLGYLDPETGRPVPHEGPWHTGDRVRQEPSTWDLFFVGRSDDVIVSSGYRIGPFEVESVLVEHPAVAEAAAVAAPDPERGSIVRAVVVLREGYAPSDDLVGELQAFARERTAPYKYPRRIDFVDALPKTPSGKVRRALLRGE